LTISALDLPGRRVTTDLEFTEPFSLAYFEASGAKIGKQLSELFVTAGKEMLAKDHNAYQRALDWLSDIKSTIIMRTDRRDCALAFMVAALPELTEHAPQIDRLFPPVIAKYQGEDAPVGIGHAWCKFIYSQQVSPLALRAALAAQ
jgi:hypothetical protein